MKLSLGLSWVGVMAVAMVACSSSNGGGGNAQPAACKTGDAVCACYPNGTCNAGLTCIANICLNTSLASGGSSGFGGSAGDMSVAGTGGASGAGNGGTSNGGTSYGGAGSGGAGNGGVGGDAPQGGMSGGGGSGGADPNVIGCALVTSCTSCCDTTGVFALDSVANDRTALYVTDFQVAAGSASAAFNFPESDDVGAIFFHFNSPQSIGSLDITGSGTGGTLEIALVRSNGADGCIYPVVGGVLSSTPNACWGLGAGPYAVLPADQIEIRVRSISAGPAALNVKNVQFGP